MQLAMYLVYSYLFLKVRFQNSAGGFLLLETRDKCGLPDRTWTNRRQRILLIAWVREQRKAN